MGICAIWREALRLIMINPLKCTLEKMQCRLIALDQDLICHHHLHLYQGPTGIGNSNDM